MTTTQVDFRKRQFLEALTIVAQELGERYWAVCHGEAVAAEPADETANGGKFLNRREVARRLAVSTSSVDRFSKQGLLNPVRQLLPTVRFRETDVEMLKKNRQN